MISRLSLVIATVALPGLVSIASASTSSSVESIAEKFQTTMVECPGNIWPDYSWSDLQVVLVRPSQNSSMIWSGKNKTLQSVQNSMLSQKALSASFSFMELNGIEAMTLNTEEDDSNSNRIFRLGVHEFFHQVAQKKWKKSKGMRGTTYPQSHEPRIFRRMLFDLLRSYLASRGNDSTALGKAAFWFNKWRSQFPQEALNSADQYEGTAEYAEVMADLIAHAGCNASNQELLNIIEKDDRTQMGRSVTGQVFDLSFEGYDIGGVSALILRLITNDTLWYEAVESGITPVEYLLKNVTPIPDSIPTNLVDIFKATADRINQEIGGLIESDLTNYTSPDYVRIAIPQDWLSVNLGPKYFVLSERMAGAMILPMARDLQFEHQNSVIQSKTNKVFFFDPNNPCGPSLSTLIHKGEVGSEGATSIINSPRFTGRFDSERILDKNNLPWICAR